MTRTTSHLQAWSAAGEGCLLCALLRDACSGHGPPHALARAGKALQLHKHLREPRLRHRISANDSPVAAVCDWQLKPVLASKQWYEQSLAAAATCMVSLSSLTGCNVPGQSNEADRGQRCQQTQEGTGRFRNRQALSSGSSTWVGALIFSMLSSASAFSKSRPLSMPSARHSTQTSNTCCCARQSTAGKPSQCMLEHGALFALVQLTPNVTPAAVHTKPTQSQL